MPAKWRDILSNPSQYPDDFTVALKDGQTMTLADMRAYDREHEGELTQRLTAKEQDLAKREKTVNEASVQLSTVIEKTAERAGLSVEELLQGKAPVTKKAVAASSELDENDPLVGQVVKEIKGLRAELAAAKGDIDNVRKSALGPMLNTYLEDYYESKWEKLAPTLPKSAKVTREEALKYAQDNKYVDTRGRFDLSKAVKDLTLEDRINEEADKRAEVKAKVLADKQVIANAPKPSGTHINVKPDKSLLNANGRVKSLDDVMNDAFNDVELWRGIQGQA